jgi:hypothetical protein
VAGFVDDVQQDAVQADAHALAGQRRADADLFAGDVDAAVDVDQPVDLDRGRQLASHRWQW